MVWLSIRPIETLRHGEFDLSESFIEGSFVGPKGGVGTTQRGKGTKRIAVANCDGAPIAVHMASASPQEVTLAEATIDTRFTQKRPVRMIGDKACDSDRLDRNLVRLWIEMIAPHRANRGTATWTPDGRPLRRPDG